MKIIILHRIPFGKIRYDKIISHQQHDVYYLCLPDHSADLPTYFNIIDIETTTFNAEYLIEHYGVLLASADRIIARSEYDLIEAAKLREFFMTPGDKTEDILPLRNKWIMRHLSKQQGIRQPAFWHPAAFIQQPWREGRFVFKPREEASSNGILLGNYTEIAQAITELEDGETMMVEAFIEGDVYHFDGWVDNGELVAFVSSYYICDCLRFSKGAPLGSVQTTTVSEHTDLVLQTLAALGYQSGSFHFEAIKDACGQFWFLETAARVGGAGVAETFQLRTGLNLYHADLLYQLYGSSPAKTEAPNSVFYGWFIYPAHLLNSGYVLDFSPEKWSSNLLHYKYNPYVLPDRSISYAPESSPLSGVVFGAQEQIPEIIESIFSSCTVGEIP